jgi:hypothetical protein
LKIYYRKFLKNLTVFTILLNLLIISNGSSAVDQPVVTVVPDSTNTFSEYTIQSGVSNAASASLRANTDSILVRFNASTTVPSSIDPSYVTINNTNANSVTINGQIVLILTPVNVPRNGAFTVEIDAAAEVTNPATPGDYFLDAKTDRGPDANQWVQSSAYTISQSNSNVSPAAVTPDPSVVSEAAQYTISFSTGTSGSLTANEGTISIAFPNGTTVPSGSISGVTVNGTSANTTANADTAVITTPVNIDNEGAVTVVFNIGAGLQNPATDSSYTIAVRTSSEQNFITSDPYTISPAGQLSITAISSKPDTVNQGGDFIFNFRTGSFGGLTANNDTIFVIFSRNTYLPTNMSPLNVSVSSGGFSDAAADISINKSDPADADTALIITPINIGNSADVTVNFNTASGYLNPSIAGNYTIQLKTSQDQTAVESNPFSIVDTETKISKATVTPTSIVSAAVTSYTIDFNLGSLGRLVSGQSTITLDFHSDYSLQSDTTYYDASTISVAEGTPVSIPETLLTINTTENTIQIIIPESVEPQNGDNIVIFLGDATTQPITNPTTGASGSNYTLGVKTSVEATNIPSNTYNIGGTAITINSVTLSDATVNNVSQYTFNITTGADLLNRGGQDPDDEITMIFPEGTVVPASISAANITINGSAAQSVSVNQANRTVVAKVNTNVTAGTFDVILTTSANIINPVIPSSTFYKVTMSTTPEQAPVISSAYAITGDNTQAIVDTMTLNPSVVSAQDIVVDLSFSTSTTGKIAGGKPAGSSTITIDFDTGTIIPASITASTIEVNSTPCQTVNVNSSGAGGVVTLTVPNGITINNSSTVNIKFNETAGLDNNTVSGTFKVQVKTSSDTTYSSIAGSNGDYILTASQSLSVNSVLPNPTTQNSSASYSINFNLGSSGALGIGDSIRIVFPNNTSLPASINLNDVTVEGTNPSENPTIEGDTLTIKSPSAFSNLAEISVLINQTAGILNPTLVQGYTLKVITSAEPGPFVSPSYNITQTSSTVSAADVTVATPTPSTSSVYTIDFSVGTNGRLIDGTSTFTITFESNTGVSTNTADYDNSTIAVNGGSPVSIATDVAVSGQEVTITIPTGLTISNNDQISIVLDDGTTDPITNPATSGDYTLQVKSSVETTNITSNSYTISSTSAVTGITVSLSPDIVNATSTDTVNFTLQNALTQDVGTITVTFPFNTFVPSSIATSNVRVASAAGTPTVFSNASAVSVNPATRAVTVTVPNDITAGHNVSVAFLTGAGIQNPSIFGSYTLQVRTSTQPLNGTSASYTLQATTTTISGLSVSVDPTITSVMGEYTYSFTTGSRGRLVSGTSTISLSFPDDITFTQGAPASSKITVNSVQAGAVTLNEGTGTDDTLIVTVPSSVTIGNNSNVTVIIDQSSGIQNASTYALLTYNAKTSVEDTWPVGYDYSLPVELNVFESLQKDERIILNWETESEIDNAYWLIEKKEISKEEYEKIQSNSLRVSETEVDFDIIAKIKGQGSVSNITEYTYTDDLVEYGKIYAYRLIDISYTGLHTYHNSIIQEMSLPKYFSLEQNYPNPFNPSTSINFILPKATKVSLVIYDVLGRKVKKLLNNKKYEPGKWKIVWTGQNQNGNKVASGIYIYRIMAGEYTKTKKMVLIR